MVSFQATTLYLDEEDTVTVTIEASCAHLHRSVPRASSTFDISVSPEQEELKDLMVVIGEGTHSSVAVQVAVWIVTDDVSRPELDSRYVRKITGISFVGTPAASDKDVINAMKLVGEAGISIAEKEIYAE